MRIFITTDLSKLKNAVLPKVRNNNKGINQISSTNPILYFNSNTNEFSTESIHDSRITLILDNTYKESIKQFAIISDTDYLLHHNIPVGQSYTEFTNKIQGQHERHDQKYPPVFKVIFDDNITITKKVEEIIEILGFEKNVAKDALKKAAKTLTLVYLKSQNNKDVFLFEINEVNERLKKVNKYLQKKENFDELINSISEIINTADIDTKIKRFQEVDSKIHTALFD